MKRAIAVLALAVAGAISGCSPAVSVRPLYMDADSQKPIVEPRIEGEWISPNTEEPEKAGTDEEIWLRWKITPPDKPGQPYGTYSAEFRPAKPDPDKGEEFDAYDVRLVAMGDKLFFDAEFRSHTESKLVVGATDALGLVPAHVVGRIWVQQDFLRIALVKPDYVEENWPAGFYRFNSSTYGDDDIVITGSTQELRDFLVRNADNPKALGYAVYLCRPGTECGMRAAEDALARAPDDDDTLDLAAKFFFARHNYARAAALRRRRVELDPKDITRHTDLSEALLFSRDFPGARRELAEAQRLSVAEHPKPVGHDVQSAYAQASEGIVWSYFLEGKYAETVNSAKSYKPDERNFSVNPVLLSYFSLLRLAQRDAAESLLRDEIAGFRGLAEEHVLLLQAQGRVSNGLPYEAKTEPLRRTSFFGGLRDIATSHSDDARFHLKNAASGESRDVIGLAAQIELERLGPKPKK